MREDDKALICRSLAGDLTAFEELIRCYQSRVCRTLYFLLENQDDVEDVAQEVFIRVFRHLKTFRGDCEFSTWLHKIVLNTLRNWVRTRKQNVSLDELNDYSYSWSTGDEGSFLTSEEAFEVRKAIRALPEHYRETLVLRHFHDMSYEDIARVQRVPLGTVRSRLAKGRQLLFDRLSGAGIIESSEGKVIK